MELQNTNETQRSDLQTTVIAGRLGDFVRELTTIIKTVQFGRLQFTSDGYNAMETASRDLAKLSQHMADEVKALAKRRRSAVVAEGQKLLSCAESTKVELMMSQKPRRQVVFVRNIQLFFNPPEVSKLDSLAVQKRKQLTRERCETLRSLPPNKMILWAAAFAPSVWDSNVLQKSTFDFVVEFLEPGDSLQWPDHIYEILDTLALEQPLCHSSNFKEFLTDMHQSVGMDQNITHSSSHEEQTLQSDVPGVDEGAQEVIERAFLVPHSKLDKLLKLHPQFAPRHSIILTIPIADRVATVLISIPREDAIRFGWESSLPVIFNSNPQHAFVQSTSARPTLPQFGD